MSKSNPLFESRTKLRNAINKYFDWCEENPIVHNKGTDKNGNPIIEQKMRPYSINRLCERLDVSEVYFHSIADDSEGSVTFREDLAPIYHWCINRIRAQEREYGLSGMLNHNILAKEASKPVDKVQNTKAKVEFEGPDSMEALKDFFRGK